MINFGKYILIGFILLIIELVYFNIASKCRIVDIPHHQSSHKGAVIRGGGIVFYASYLLWSFTHGLTWHGGLIGLTILVLVSFIDDMCDISPKIRLVCQFVAILFLFYHSGLIRTAPYVILILSITCVGAVNIFNFMDGINGMTGGYSLVVALALLYVDLNMIHFCDPSLLGFVILSLLVFNIFNFRQKAICFAGDVGSLAIGFILVYLVLRLCLRGQSMSWISMFAVYGVDGGMTILHRILLKENLMKPHKKHVYQIMTNELNMPHLLVSGIYMGLQIICCAWYIIHPGYLTFFLEAGILSFIYLLFMKKYYHLHIANH